MGGKVVEVHGLPMLTVGKLLHQGADSLWHGHGHGAPRAVLPHHPRIGTHALMVGTGGG